MDRYEKEKLNQRKEHIDKHSEETMDELRLEEKCPQIRGSNGQDLCAESERPSGRIKVCLLESGDKCEEYEDYLRELKEDRDGKRANDR